MAHFPGSPFQDDFLPGTFDNDTFEGFGGDDLIDGGPGFDAAFYSGTSWEYDYVLLLYGGLQIIDLIVPGDGIDILYNIEFLEFVDQEVLVSDLTIGSAGHDEFFATLDETFWHGGAGLDEVDYSQLQANFTLFVDFNTGTATKVGHSSDTFSDIEHVTCGGGGDAVVGNASGNKVEGLGGNDFMFGGHWDGLQASGADSLHGGEGHDAMWGFDGFDFIEGGFGNDSCVMGGGNDTANGDSGNDLIFGGDFDANGGFKTDSGDDTCNGGDGEDAIWGADGHDTANGDSGNDFLTLGHGNDNGNGGADNDFVLGGHGNDNVSGGGGFDYLYGDDPNDASANGADTFEFNRNDSYDSVFDFDPTEGDKLKIDTELNVDTFEELKLQMTNTSFEGTESTTINFTSVSGTVDQLTVYGVTPDEITPQMCEFG